MYVSIGELVDSNVQIEVEQKSDEMKKDYLNETVAIERNNHKNHEVNNRSANNKMKKGKKIYKINTTHQYEMKIS